MPYILVCAYQAHIYSFVLLKSGILIGRSNFKIKICLKFVIVLQKLNLLKENQVTN